VLIRPVLAGIDAADLNFIDHPQPTALLSAFINDDAIIPGHEVTGVVTAIADGTRTIHEGDHVIVDPMLFCRHKGLPPCSRCRDHDGHTCENLDRAGPLGSGRSIGFSSTCGGAWSDGFLAHEDMLIQAGDIPDHRAVIAEPAAVALQAIQSWKRAGERVCIIGLDTHMLLVAAALSRLYPDLDITVMPAPQEVAEGEASRATVHHTALDRFARRGVSRIFAGSAPELLDQTAKLMGARRLFAQDGGLPVLDGGFDAIFDGVSSATTINMSLRMLRAGGSLILMGQPGVQQIDWSLVWWRELSVVGASLPSRFSEGRRTFDIVKEWLQDESFPVDDVVTHRYPLEQFDQAFKTARTDAGSGLPKVVFESAEGTLRPTSGVVEEEEGPDPLEVLASARRRRTKKEEAEV
jgi:threonine dehydrogenase-like Zn-dependent dehydrogenase